MIVTVEQRNSIDAKTFGGVYMEMIDKMKDITLIEALSRIMVLAFREIRELADISEIIISQILDIFMGIVMKKYLNIRLAA